MTSFVMQLGINMPASVAKAKLDNAFKKPVDTLTESEAKKIYADLFQVGTSIVFNNLDGSALLELYRGSEITSGAELYNKIEETSEAIEARFNL
jgi:hypothetical protein